MATTQLDFRALPRIHYALDLTMVTLGHTLKMAGAELRDGIRKHTPKSSGKLWYKCKIVRVKVTPYVGKVTVGWVRKDFLRKKFYAVFIGEGTGIHGKGKKKIYPKKTSKKPMIRYVYKGKWVSMKSIKGIRPRKMLEKGYKTALPGMFAWISRTFYHSMRATKRA